MPLPADLWHNEAMGSYERYQPPTESRSGISRLWLVALVGAMGFAGAMLISQWSRRPDLDAPNAATPADPPVSQSEPGTVPPTGAAIGPGASPYAKDARIAELEMELRDKDFELSRRGSEIESLEQRVSQLQEDSERYRAGLDQAVAELNQLRAEIGRLETTARADGLGTAMPHRTPGVQPVGPPYVTTSSMGFVTVSGFVNNPTRAAARGKLKVSLVGSAGVIETREFPMYIPPNSQERYDITFPNIFPTERIAAQATWVP